VDFTISVKENEKIWNLLNDSPELFTSNDYLLKQSDVEFVKVLENFDRIIYSNTNNIPESVFKSAAKSTTFIVRQKPLTQGRLELLNYFEEQSISHSYHRYGNISSK